jgi:hypothetical protein
MLSWILGFLLGAILFLAAVFGFYKLIHRLIDFIIQGR